jgi:hypothetical protein
VPVCVAGPFRDGCCIGATIIFEQPKAGSDRRQLAALLGRVLRRLEKSHLHITWWFTLRPALRSKKGELAGYWKTLADDFSLAHEILPIVETKSKSYSIKETYFQCRTAGAGSRAASRDRSKLMRFGKQRAARGGIISTLVALVFLVVFLEESTWRGIRCCVL